MLIPINPWDVVLNYKFLSFFMPGQAETYFAEAIKRQFNIQQSEAATSVTFGALNIQTTWKGNNDKGNLIQLEFSHYKDQYHNDAQGKVRFKQRSFTMNMEEIALGQLEMKGIVFSQSIINLFDRYIKKGHDPNKDDVSDQIVYALLLSSLSYTKGFKEESGFIGLGLADGLKCLAEVVRKNNGLQYTDVFFEEAKLKEGSDIVSYYLKPNLLLEIVKITEDYKKRNNHESISQLGFIDASQNTQKQLTLTLQDRQPT